MIVLQYCKCELLLGRAPPFATASLARHFHSVRVRLSANTPLVQAASALGHCGLSFVEPPVARPQSSCPAARSAAILHAVASKGLAFNSPHLIYS